jgi:hypothetical protein
LSLAIYLEKPLARGLLEQLDSVCIKLVKRLSL